MKQQAGLDRAQETKVSHTTPQHTQHTLLPHTDKPSLTPTYTELLKKLTEYTIETFFPEIWKASEDPIARYLGFYREVVLSTAALVAEW